MTKVVCRSVFQMIIINCWQKPDGAVFYIMSGAIGFGTRFLTGVILSR